MTLRFGQPYIEYEADGMVRDSDGNMEYQYSPRDKIRWLTADEFLAQEIAELDTVKVVV